MPHERRPFPYVKRTESFLIELIGMCHTRMLALVFNPAFDHETLDHTTLFGHVLPYVPTNGAIAVADRAEFAQCLHEFGEPRRLNPIFNFDENGTTVARWLH